MKLAEIFPPGDFLKEELEARNWSQIELAEVMGRSVKVVNELVLGKRSITPDTAVQLGAALGTGPEFWMNLESQYQLSKVIPQENAVSRRARLYEKFPVREMIKRGWVNASDSIDNLEMSFLTYFKLANLDEEIKFAHAAKAASATTAIQQATQKAWLLAAQQLAKRVIVPAYNPDALRAALPRLQALMIAPEESRHVTKLLNECGVRFVVVEPLPSSLIDGACFWLERDQPAVALSTRLDRIDNFWFVLRHELEHILCGHGMDEEFICDEDILGTLEKNKSIEEKTADDAASDYGVSNAEIESYVARAKPYYFSEQKILNMAARLRVHPGIVLGRLQYRFKDDPNVWKYLRPLLVKTREFVIQSSPHDGWGHSAISMSEGK